MERITTVSLTNTLIGKSDEFLTTEGMECLITQRGIVQLMKQLVNYKEEGKELFPEVYIFDDVEMVMKILPFSQHHYIGTGDKTNKTMLKALKKCAPLTDGGWAIFINRNENSFDYGVFRAGTSILSVSISELLIESEEGNDNDGIKVVLIRQISNKLIEVRGIKSDPLFISFGANEELNVSPIKNQNDFIKSIVESVDEKYKSQTSNFFRKVFDEVLKKGHGTLACVMNNKKKEPPKKLSDGITLKNRISIPLMIKKLEDNKDSKTNYELNGCFSLISGMMQSDGITLFTDNGEVVAYNIFVKHPPSIAKTNTSGGARSRTYITLKGLINKGLKSAYIQSQDGKIQYSTNGE